MNVMADKGQPQHPWQYQMYGGFASPYQQYPPYHEPHQYFNYYHGALPYPAGVNGQPVNHMVQSMPMKQFSHGGQLQPFGQNKDDVSEREQQEEESSKEMPPLPPGPPPPASLLPQPSPPGAPFFQQVNISGPVRFNMNRQQRPQFNQQPFNNSGSSKKKRKKNKNKFNQQQQQMHQQMNFNPPLPPHQLIRAQAPPLPPGPPPPAPLPPPEEIQVPETKVKAALPLDPKVAQQDWPVELQNYITSCYAKCQDDVDKDRISIILKGKIMQATNDDTLWIKDWSKEPIPMLLSEMDSVSVQPVFKAKESAPTQLKKRLCNSLTGRLGMKLHSRAGSRSRSRSRSRSPHKSRQRSPPRPSRRRRDRSDSSESENDWTPPVTSKKSKGRNLDHSFSKQRGKNKKQGKGRGNFYSEFGNAVGGELPVNNELLEKRAARFNCVRRDKATTFTVTNTSLGIFEDTNGDFELEDCHVVGVCQDIEKPYLRLTTAPEASQVRPPDVLAQSLTHVKERWLKNHDYHYACEQLKSIRQDLTVQGIRDKLTVSVYETHARIALEKGDHAEFNQCQSQLKLLHDELSAVNRNEFIAYRILYFIFTKENMDLNTVMQSLTDADQEDECVSHALEVRSAWALGNYHRLFCLYKKAPRMSSYLMDWFLPRERKLAVKTIIKAYRQTLPVSFLTQELAFDSDSLCREFLSQFGVVYADGEWTKIDCKTSAASVASA